MAHYCSRLRASKKSSIENGLLKLACWNWHVTETQYTINITLSRNSIVYAIWKLWLKRESLCHVEAGEGNWVNFQMLWLGEYFLTSHRVSLNGLNTPQIWSSAREHFWVSVNIYEHLLNMIECPFTPLIECEHLLDAIEWVWMPLSENEHLLNVIECTWTRLSLNASECAWMSLHEYWKGVNENIGPVQFEGDVHWHQFT